MNRALPYAAITAALAAMALVGLFRFPATVPPLGGTGPFPRLRLAVPDLWVTGVLWAAMIVGTAGVVAGLVAVRRGRRPRGLLAGGLLPVAVLVVVPPMGTTDTMDYVVYGRMAVLGHNPHVMTPREFRATGDPVGALAPEPWQDVPSVYGPLAARNRTPWDTWRTMTPLHDPSARGFTSDNCAGVHPEVLAAIGAANGGHQPSYGGDVYTARLQEVFKEHFGERAEAYPVFNGTGANVLSLRSMTELWSAVICAESAHVTMDEGGAPEKVGGLKLLPVPTPDGKLTPALIDRQATGWDDEHRAQPRVVSITQSTELGTVYTAGEIAAICAHAHDLGMTVHVDGTRLANAAAALDLPLRAFTTDVGVDVISFGGTKNGLLYGEVVVVVNPSAVRGMRYLRKTAMQLSSKMRFVSAQFIALLEGDLWLRSAGHSNAMTARLHAAVRDLPGVTVPYEPQANELFVRIDKDVTARLRKRFPFETWNEETGVVRWVCSFDTTEADVDGFAAVLAEELRG